METKITQVMEEIENVIMLDADNFSEQWENILEEPDTCISPHDQTLSMVLPIPDHNETLLIYQNHSYRYTKQTLSTVKNHIQEERFLDYDCLSRALKRFDCFGKRLFPIISSTSCLFPFGGPIQHAAWINPIEIEEIETTDTCTQINMRGGLIYCTQTRKRTIEDHAINALAILAAYRYDRLHKEQAGFIPLDYLSLPNTPFIRSLCQNPLLQEFLLPLGALERHYDSERFMKNVTNVSKVIKSGVLSYDTFSKLLK